MSKPAVTFGDPERLEIDYLTAAYAGRSGFVVPETISPDFPAEPLGDKTHLQVELETSSTELYPVSEVAQVRFVAHAGPGQRTAVKRLASVTQGLVHAQPGSAAVAGTRVRGGRSKVITDPQTGNVMVWFLADVKLKATPLAALLAP